MIACCPFKDIICLAPVLYTLRTRFGKSLEILEDRENGYVECATSITALIRRYDCVPWLHRLYVVWLRVVHSNT